jgi:hypothetical protein
MKKPAPSKRGNVVCVTLLTPSVDLVQSMLLCHNEIGDVGFK